MEGLCCLRGQAGTLTSAWLLLLAWRAISSEKQDLSHAVTTELLIPKLKGILDRNQPHRQSRHTVHWTFVSQFPVRYKKKIKQQWHFKPIIQKGQEIQTNTEELDNINISLMRRDNMIRLSATLQ